MLLEGPCQEVEVVEHHAVRKGYMCSRLEARVARRQEHDRLELTVEAEEKRKSVVLEPQLAEALH